ncbi:hypothetical protein STEG23_023419 [Scotinomys teguina]
MLLSSTNVLSCIHTYPGMNVTCRTQQAPLFAISLSLVSHTAEGHILRLKNQRKNCGPMGYKKYPAFTSWKQQQQQQYNLEPTEHLIGLDPTEQDTAA